MFEDWRVPRCHELVDELPKEALREAIEMLEELTPHYQAIADAQAKKAEKLPRVRDA